MTQEQLSRGNAILAELSDLEILKHKMEKVGVFKYHTHIGYIDDIPKTFLNEHHIMISNFKDNYIESLEEKINGLKKEFQNL